jgi:hypothetical protein
MERAEATAIHRHDIDDRIRTLYQHYDPTHYCVDDHYLFTDKTLDERIASPLDDKTTWLQAVSWADKIAAETASNEHTQMRQTMQAWLNST